MEAAGYNVTIQPYKFPYSAFVGTPAWSEDTPTPHDFALVTDWNPGTEQRDANAEHPAGRRHRHPADRDPELDERLHLGRLQPGPCRAGSL